MMIKQSLVGVGLGLALLLAGRTIAPPRVFLAGAFGNYVRGRSARRIPASRHADPDGARAESPAPTRQRGTNSRLIPRAARQSGSSSRWIRRPARQSGRNWT